MSQEEFLNLAAEGFFSVEPDVLDELHRDGGSAPEKPIMFDVVDEAVEEGLGYVAVVVLEAWVFHVGDG